MALPRRASGRALVTAVSADLAADFLAARLLVPGSRGLEDLLQHVVASAAVAEAGDGGSLHPAFSTPGCYQQSGEGLAALLASFPDRAASVQSPLLDPAAFVPAVVRELLTLLAAQEAGPSRQQQPAGSSAASRTPLAATATAVAATYVGDVLVRLCRRGHASLVAATLWSLLADCRAGPADASHAAAVLAASETSPAAAAANGTPSTPSSPIQADIAATITSTVGAIEDPVALERLVVAFLWQAAASTAADSTALAVLRTLLPPAAWAARADVRVLLSQQLLTQPRLLLPAPALRCILSYLHQAAPAAAVAAEAARATVSVGPAVPDGVRLAGAPGTVAARSGTDSRSPRGNVLAAAAAHVAQLWADLPSIQRLPLRQQAYLTAALAGALGLLPREVLDAQPGLLPTLLQGVSNRLESPEKVRGGHQGSRGEARQDQKE